MRDQRALVTRAGIIILVGSVVGSGASANAQTLAETFNGATGVGSAQVLSGTGYNEVDGWDTGITDEWAYAGTWGDGAVTSIDAMGTVSGGNFGSGGGAISVSGPTFTDGGWFGGLYWPNLSLPHLDPSALTMTAEIMGGVVGGAYELRLEGNWYEPFGGLDENFNSVAGTVVPFFAPGGGLTGFTDNWEEGLSGEAAFAGMTAGTIGAGGGAVAEGVVAGGWAGGAGRITVTDITTPIGERWWGGLVWANRTLPTTDLSQLSLSARIRGTANLGAGELFGEYMLRIEDTDTDYLAFQRTADGSFQQVGGALATASHGGLPDVPTDNTFDPTKGPFGVVLVFYNDEGNTWGTGGSLTIDNLYLTVGQTRHTVGSISFAGTSTGGYQSVGGVLTNGVSTFSNVEEDFENVSGPDGSNGVFFDTYGSSWTPGWDDGLEKEEAFAGVWGLVTVNGTGAARGTLTGGDGGSGGGQIEMVDMDVVGGNCAAGGWWAGLQWRDQWLPSVPLDGISLTAKVKGEAQPGQTRGWYELRIEDRDRDYLGFAGFANGLVQNVGGLLSAAPEEGSLPDSTDGDDLFDPTRGPFTVVIAFKDECGSWGTGGKLTVDDVSLTQPAFGDGVESFSAVVAFADETGTWPSGGTLNVDNLLVASVTAIPAVSTWGIMATMLMMMTAGTVMLRWSSKVQST